MVSQTAALFRLQTLDSKLDEVLSRLAEIRRQLDEDQEVRKARQAVEYANEQQRQWQAKIGQFEVEKVGLQEAIKEAETRLYSGQIFNPRELTDLQDKVAELNGRLESLEEPLLESMVNYEETSNQLESSQGALAQIMESKAITAGELGKEQTLLANTMTELQIEVAQARSPVDPAGLQLYDRLRSKPGGVSVAVISGSECGGCGVELTSRIVQQVRRGEVTTCPTCGRILYI